MLCHEWEASIARMERSDIRDKLRNPNQESPHSAPLTGDFTPINPGGFGSNWCGAAFIVAGKFDLTAMANLK